MKKQSFPKHSKLRFVRNFLKNISTNISIYSPLSDKHGDFWYRKDEGFLFLKPKEREEYGKVHEKLVKEFCKEEDLSDSAIDSALKTAVFECLDISKRRNADIDVRLDKAIGRLWKFLNLPPEEYEVYIKVAGLDIASLPANFGRIRFVVFNAYQLQKLKKPFQMKNPADLSDRLDAIDDMFKPLLNHSIAIVKVNARDKQAAKALAEREVRATLECLNFFSDIIPSCYTSLSIPTERKSNSIEWATVATESGTVNTFGVFTDTDATAGGFSIKKLRQNESPMVRSAIKRIESLLRKSDDEVKELTLRAVRWGGRATTEETREESFLFFVIALECLLSPRGNSGELRYRFSQRIAQLIGRDTSERKEVMEKAKKLYDIRSKIVHSGHYETTEKRYYEVRNIAKIVIFKLLTNRYVKRFHHSKEFEDWLNELSL